MDRQLLAPRAGYRSTRAARARAAAAGIVMLRAEIRGSTLICLFCQASVWTSTTRLTGAFVSISRFRFPHFINVFNS